VRVTDSKDLKLLLVEDDLEDEQLLCEALIEIEEKRLWCNWRTATVVQVDQLADALDCLRQDRFDAVLLNLSLPDGAALLDTFLEAKACAGGAPIIVLADEEDENLANRLLREGAQDVVLKQELECAPLARSVRYAIERQRRAGVAGTSPLADHLTGALTRPAFLAVAEPYTQVALESHAAPLLALVDIPDLPRQSLEDREARELVLLRAGDALRDVFPAPAVLGRVAPCRFALIVAGLSESTVETLLTRACAEIEAACPGPATTPHFSVTELNRWDGIDELLGGGAGASPEVRWHVKTVMLAD
jgi:DNA-binding NarL/FixJ family response regulator